MSSTQTKTESVIVKRLAGKVAVVTGGSRGIGAAIAKRLADEGANVAITYEKSKEAADSVVASIAKLGNGAVAIKANASSPEQAKELAKQVENTLGKIDILVNNAGVYDSGPIDQVGIEQYEHIFDVNVKGVIATTVAVLPLMKQGGRIINISSGAAEVTLANFSIYSASKAALNTLTRIWAQELGARKITVNGVAPGTTVTDMFNA
ncbi:MAG: SDR family NAD(P)-dependent oxidoreductase, partial [Terriglobales bacterium]